MKEKKDIEHEADHKRQKKAKKPVKKTEPVSARPEKRAMKTLGQYLRAFKTEPLNKIIRGD